MAGLPLTRYVSRMTWLDPAIEKLQQRAAALLAPNGQPTALKDVLNGRWLGHPLHPALTDVPLGAWTAALIFDVVALLPGSKGLRRSADASLALGAAGAVAAAAAGIADWSDTQGTPRRVGGVHALLNTLALTLNLVSLSRRLRGRRGSGVLLSMAAYMVASSSAWLGGELVSVLGMGVSHNIWPEPPADFVAVLDQAALPEGRLTRARAGDVPVCLLRRDGQISAITDWCPHLGGSLADGTLEGGAVTCPWHGSRFELESGAVLRGPATMAARRFEVRLREGKVEVKPAAV